MYKIGELSKLCSLPVKTLRYYDAVGLLEPDYIDRFTSYRYYSAARLADCNRIVALKELGFSLDDIHRHLKADSADDVIFLIDAKTAELKSVITETESQLRRLSAARQIIAEGDAKMYDIVFSKRNLDTISAAYVRKIFKTKEEAYQEAERMKSRLPKQIVGARTLVINYETEYRENDFDLAACVEITGKLPASYGYEARSIAFPGEVASLVGPKSELDAAYHSMLRQLDENGAQIVGAFYEFYHADGTAELKVPVYRPAPTDSLENDDFNLPFVNDEEALGKWKLVDIVPSEEQFLYGHEKCPHSGWLDELVFLENGERYWAVGGWTKGVLYTDGDHKFRNRYTIKRQDGRRLLFLEMNHFLDGGGEKLAMPQIWVYEKVADGVFHAEDIKRRDFVDYPFVPDQAVLGEWKVRDFYWRDLDSFDPKRQNYATEGLYFLKVTFLPDGACLHLTKQHESRLRWTKGYMLNMVQQIASAYKIRSVDGAEYLIVEWKTGDYQFGSDARIYWYIFTRA